MSRPGRPDGCLSDFVLDQLMTDLLEREPAERAREHLASCARCSQRLREFENVDVPVLEATRPREVAAPPRSRHWPWLAAAVVLLGVGARALFSGPDPGDQRLALGGTRTKGALTLSVIAKRASGEVVRLAAGATVAPGESLRFELASASPGYAVVLGFDARGAVSVYAPTAGAPVALSSAPPSLLPDTILADETLGPELIVALSCAGPPVVGELTAQAERAFAQVERDPRRLQSLGTACAEAHFLIEKTVR